MAKDWGLKITKAGTATTTTDPRLMLFSSKYQMFKYHGDYPTTLTLNPGDTSKTVSVTHGLGYVPAFLPYFSPVGSSDMYLLYPFGSGVGYTVGYSAWADTTKIYFKVQYFSGAYNRIDVDATDYYSNRWNDNSSYYIGKHDGASRVDGAVRFDNVPITSGAGLISASMRLYIRKVAIPDGKVRWVTYGIDEDDTGSFGDPFGRSRTTASGTSEINAGAASEGDYFDVNVIDQLNEIRGRAGWASGNAMGFTMIENNGSDENTYIYDFTPAGGGGMDSYLRLTLSGSTTINFRAIVFKDKIDD